MGDLACEEDQISVREENLLGVEEPYEVVSIKEEGCTMVAVEEEGDIKETSKQVQGASIATIAGVRSLLKGLQKCHKLWMDTNHVVAQCPHSHRANVTTEEFGGDADENEFYGYA